MTTIDVTRIAKDAEAALAGRIEAATALAAAEQRVSAARDALAEAEADHGSAYQRALTEGWTVADLKEFGLTAPGRRPGRSRRSASDAGPAESESNPTASIDDEPRIEDAD